MIRRLAVLTGVLGWCAAGSFADDPPAVPDRPPVRAVAFSPDGKRLVAATGNKDRPGAVVAWDVATGKSLRKEKTRGEELYTVDWSPKGDLLVTAGLKAKIIIWDAKELKPLRELDAPDWVIRARFSPDGSRLFTAGGSQVKTPDRKITVWGLDK